MKYLIVGVSGSGKSTVENILQIPPSVVRKRLQQRPGVDEFGKSETEISHVLDWQSEFEREMIAKGAIPVDAQKPINDVVQEILSNL